jgi:type IV secretory pathway ATPase VirB11/archaellum biosynthesis ATPase
MPHANETRSHIEKVDNTVERLVQHLLRWPCDLIDTRHLLRCFQVSTVDFQRALARLEEMAVQPSS